MNNIKRAEISVSGRVQGVFFRQKTKIEAESLNLVGWVKNTEDGNVIIMAQGPKECVDALISWAKIGPSRAYVKEAKIKWLEPKDDLINFEIIY